MKWCNSCLFSDRRKTAVTNTVITNFCFVITGADILTIFDDILSIPVALLLSRLVKNL